MDIDRSKENIQPLRGGRNPVHLSAAITANSDADAARLILLQQREHEALISSYDGPDPLEPWFNYIQWVEQCFPKHGHEGHMDKLIRECLAKFENDERYIQDRRFVRLWIKYIDNTNNPLELYQNLHSRGIGTSCSELYRAWACYCEEATDYKKADHVYALGLQFNAEPKEELEQAYREFQAWCTQRLIHNDSPTKRKAASALAETRLALTTLRTVKRRNTAVVPSQRTGDNVYNYGPGMVKQQSDVVKQQQQAAAANPSRSNIMINIYADKPGPSSFPDSEYPTESTSAPAQSLLQSYNPVENQKEVGIWTNSSNKTEKVMSSKAVPGTPAPFTLFEDDRLLLPPNHVPYCKEDHSDFYIPIWVPDPPDSTKIPQYNKKEVYKEEDGGTVILEFSLEEIKARKYMTKLKSRDDLIGQSSEMYTAHNVESSAETKPHLESNQQYNEASPMSKNEFKFENVIAQSNSILNADDQHNGDLEQNEVKQEYEVAKCEGVENDERSAIANYDCGVNNGYMNDKGKIIADFDRSLLANINENNSMTFHTKEAHRELNFFTDNNDSGQEVAQFEIREDNSMTMAITKAKIGSNINAEACNDIDNQGFNKDFNYETKKQQQQQIVNIDEDLKNYYAQENLPQSNAAVQHMGNFDETSTQIFTFNVNSASTPYNNHFKKPQFIDPIKKSAVKNFNLADCENVQEKYVQNNCQGLQEGFMKVNNVVAPEANAGNEGLYPIMETTQEYRSGSSTSGSNQTTGNTIFGYTARESSGQPLSTINERLQENNTQESLYHQYQDPNLYVKRQNGVLVKGNHGNGHIQRNLNYSIHNNENKIHLASQSSQNNVNPTAHCLPPDHQYNKPNANYNQYNVPRNNSQNFQTASQQSINNSGYQHMMYQNTPNSNHGYQTHHQNTQSPYHSHSGYQNSAQAVQNPNVNNFQSPPHVVHGYQQSIQHGYQSPHNVQHGYQSPQSVQHGYQSPQQIVHGYQNAQNFQSTQAGFTSPQQGFTSPQQGFASPQQGFTSPHQGFTSPQHGFTSPQHGFASPQHVYANIQQGFTSPQPGFTSPQSGFTSPQHAYSNNQQQQQQQQHQQQQQQQHHYHKQMHQQAYANNHIQSSEYQSSPHNVQAYSNLHQTPQTPSHNYHVSNSNLLHNNQQHYQSHSYHSQNNVVTHASYQNQDGSYSSVNQSHYGNQYNNVQTPQHQNQAKQPHGVNLYNNYQSSQQLPYTVYKTPQNINSSHMQYHENAQNVSQDYSNDMQSSQNQQQQQHMQQNSLRNNASNVSNQARLNSVLHKQSTIQSPQYPLNTSEVQKQLYQSSTTAKLRSVRHEVPHVANKATPPPAANPDFSNQYLNFITSRNEPKDNANTPKFGTSPNISQKMHKNLYVSSPEQAQIPPSTEMNNSDISKESALQNSLLSSQKNVSNRNIKDKCKDQPKRQLYFDHRTEIQSEDSRESAGKESRMSTVLSRQSIQSAHTDSLHMDVDSENSMDCQTMTFKSNCSNSMVATQDIPLPANIDYPETIDPFNIELCNSLLQYVKFPNKNHYQGYYELRSVPKLQQGSTINIDTCRYSIEKQLGKGTFGSVFRGFDNNRNESIALKYQKPGRPWEYYICQEIKARITDPFMLPGYMDIHAAFLGDSASIFVSELSIFGSLLDVTNKIRTATSKCMGEYIVMLLASEMLSIVHHLHKSQIIHADIKPDNFLLMKIPQTESRAPSLQLIDFGCAIDMSLFPEDTTFNKVISTEGFTCTEMMDNLPWTYQTDLYCLAGTVYVCLMGFYMQVAKAGGRWTVQKKWPRYIKSAIWDKIFSPLLNVKDCKSMPDLLSLKEILDEFIRSDESNLNKQLRNFENILKQK